MKPHVLVVTTYYHPVVGGVEAHARQLVRYLHTHGFGVEVVTKRVGREDARRALIDGVPVRRIGPVGQRRGSGKWLMLPALAAKLAATHARYDVIVCVDYRGIGVAAVLVGRAFGRPVVAQGEVAGVLAGADRASTSGLAPESVLVRALKAPVRAIYKRAAAIVCIGRDLEREAIRAGVPPERVVYLPHGIDLTRFHPPQPGERDALRRGFGWPLDRPIVLFVGRLSIEKGVADLVEAWRRADRGDALLVLVGPDMVGHRWDAGASARAFVEANGLGDSVRFAGGVADPSPFYRAADLFVQPSHFEALGNTALEAMASGLPVVSSGVGGLADFCLDEQTALLHQPRSPQSLADAIGRALADAPLRARIASAGRALVSERFELNALMARYAGLVEAVAHHG
ncbi:MAG TPA: glycosyltransferase family 4 protein [Vicinamibacterales bacterium]|nr:glycosyltransferase family 4 protein [Vicinamibacterales bacterium]